MAQMRLVGTARKCLLSRMLGLQVRDAETQSPAEPLRNVVEVGTLVGVGVGSVAASQLEMLAAMVLLHLGL